MHAEANVNSGEWATRRRCSSSLDHGGDPTLGTRWMTSKGWVKLPPSLPLPLAPDAVSDGGASLLASLRPDGTNKQPAFSRYPSTSPGNRASDRPAPSNPSSPPSIARRATGIASSERDRPASATDGPATFWVVSLPIPNPSGPYAPQSRRFSRCSSLGTDHLDSRHPGGISGRSGSNFWTGSSPKVAGCPNSKRDHAGGIAARENESPPWTASSGHVGTRPVRCCERGATGRPAAA